MKKILSLILVLFILCPCLTVFASGNTFRLADLKLSVDIPSDLVTFTRDIKQNDPNLDLFGLSKAQMDSMMKDGNIYLNAIDPDVAFEVVVTKIESPLNDFFYLSNTELDVLASSITDGYKGTGLTVIKHEIYEHPQAKFIKIYIKQPNGNSTAYGLQYYTVYGGQAINFTIHSYAGSLTNKNEATIKQIVDSVVFDVSPQKKVAKETPAFVYTDKKSGASFTVPANWEQAELSKERDTLDVKFTSTTEEGCSILYGCVDMWQLASDEERKGYTRSDIDNTAMSKEDFAEYSGVPASQVKVETISGKEYYKVTRDQTTEMYGFSISIPTTIVMRIENAYMYTFHFSGDTSSPQYQDFLSLIGSMQYPMDNKSTSSTRIESLSLPSIIMSLIITISVYSLPIIIYRYAVLKHAIDDKKAKKITIGYAVFGFIVMAVILVAVNGNGTPGAAIFLWSWVNFRILTKGSPSCEEKSIVTACSPESNNLSPSTQVSAIPDSTTRPAAFQTTTIQIRFCHKCGAQLQNDSSFCHKCGAKINK